MPEAKSEGGKARVIVREPRGRQSCIFLGSGELLAMAAKLASRITESRCPGERGGVSWLGPGNPPLGQPARLSPVGAHLYGGTTGIALFLAAFVRVSGENELRPLVLEILEPLRKRLAAIVADPDRASSFRLGVGGLIGLGAFVYSFRRIGEWLGEWDLVREARNLVPFFSEERIAADRFLDVVGGAAGGVLSLLALGMPEDPAARTAAVYCGERLLSARLDQDGQPAGWRTLPCRPLSGFSHGAAGICHSLLRLYEWTKEGALREAAQEGLAFERSLYDPAAGNWQDLRNPGAGFSASWCHGAPGIALGRLGTLHVLDDEQVREEIHVALETTRSAVLGHLDHVCCGNMGRAEILLYASQKLERPDLLSAAHELAGLVLKRARARGRFGWVADPDVDVFDPSFFTGAAGVGYSLLRLVRPDLLPCLLLLE
jgi:type 2 lantibiotic biosynthesis protein LanM